MYKSAPSLGGAPELSIALLFLLPRHGLEAFLFIHIYIHTFG